MAELGLHHIHLHPRDAAGRESLRAADIAAALTACRAAAPGLAIGVGTGAWIEPVGPGRQPALAGWTVLPDYASVNLNEADAAEVMALLHDRRVGIEAGLWSVADTVRFLDLDPPGLTRILIELPDGPVSDALVEATAILDLLRQAYRSEEVLLHGDGATAWPCLELAVAQGLSARIGFEDVAHLPDGRPAPDNAALVRAAMAILDHHGAPL